MNSFTKICVVLFTLITLPGCGSIPVYGDTPEQFGAKMLLGNILQQTGLDEAVGIQHRGRIIVDTGVTVRNARGAVYVIPGVPNGKHVIETP